MQKVVHVHIGEVKVARKGEILTALLGSCVGVGLIWKAKRRCGLAHCLLPESPTPTFAIGGRYVDQAMRSLLALMKIKAEDLADVDVVIVGGGNMIKPDVTDQFDLVGASNLRVALREAKKHGLRLLHSESGGDEGLKIFIDASEFTYRVERIPRIVESA